MGILRWMGGRGRDTVLSCRKLLILGRIEIWVKVQCIRSWSHRGGRRVIPRLLRNIVGISGWVGVSRRSGRRVLISLYYRPNVLNFRCHLENFVSEAFYFSK